MPSLNNNDEQKLVDGVRQAVRYVDDNNMSPNDALIKVSRDLSLLPGQTRAAVSAFNNTGFALSDGGYAAFSEDIPVLTVTGVLAMLGAIGPLPLALFVSRGSFRRLALDARIIFLAMFAVLVAGAVVLLLGEWTNPATMGAEPVWRRPVLALFESSTYISE